MSRVDKKVPAYFLMALIGLASIGLQSCGVEEFVGETLGLGGATEFTESGPCDMSPDNPEYKDSDGDGFTDACEELLGLSANDPDTDGDGIQDVGEPGYDGARVELFKDNGDGIANPAVDTFINFTFT